MNPTHQVRRHAAREAAGRHPRCRFLSCCRELFSSPLSPIVSVAAGTSGVWGRSGDDVIVVVPWRQPQPVAVAAVCKCLGCRFTNQSERPTERTLRDGCAAPKPTAAAAARSGEWGVGSTALARGSRAG